MVYIIDDTGQLSLNKLTTLNGFLHIKYFFQLGIKNKLKYYLIIKLVQTQFRDNTSTLAIN